VGTPVGVPGQQKQERADQHTDDAEEEPENRDDPGGEKDEPQNPYDRRMSNRRRYIGWLGIGLHPGIFCASSARVKAGDASAGRIDFAVIPQLFPGAMRCAFLYIFWKNC
jgi:hypothetical protein